MKTKAKEQENKGYRYSGHKVAGIQGPTDIWSTPTTGQIP